MEIPKSVKNNQTHEVKKYFNFHFTIGMKFLLLVLLSLSITLSAVVINATSLFKQDNLNNIYLTSEILTSSKSEEARSWFESITKRGILLGRALSTNNNDTREFNIDRELLFAIVYKNNLITAAHPTSNTWFNKSLAQEINFKYDYFNEFQKQNKIRFEVLEAGASEVKSSSLTPSQNIILINMPLMQDEKKNFTSFISLGVIQNHLNERFSDTGPYNLALINEDGKAIVQKTGKNPINFGNFETNPIVKKMLSSPLNSEFQEYKIGEQSILGAYSKIGFNNLAVISQIPRSIAFETGNALVRRSILIALFTFSSVFIVAYLFIQSIVNPILTLKRATREITEGNFNVSVHVNSTDEMFDLSNSFNAMGVEIKRKLDNLSKINKSSIIISSTLDSDKLLNFSIDSVIDLLNCQRAITWFQAKHQTLSVQRNWFNQSPSFSREQLGKKIKYYTEPTLLQIENIKLLVAPIREKSKISGYFILAEKKNEKEFNEEDLFIAGTLSTSIGSSFENIRLLLETADKARMEKELETAKHVQNTMFPPNDINIKGLRVCSYYTPAAECGGDWWGCMELPDNKILLTIGDATGHGVPAAMVTATAKAVCSVIHALSGTTPQLTSSPSTILQLLNKAVYESTHGKILMTFFIAILDKATGNLIYSSASHDPIYWYKAPISTELGPAKTDRSCLDALLVQQGPRLGQDPNPLSYQQAQIKMNPGDFLLLYTDGLPEGINSNQKEYGDQRFQRSIVKHAGETTDLIRDQILADFHKFIESEPLQDDITLAICQLSAISQ